MFTRYLGLLVTLFDPTTIQIVVGEWSWKLYVGGSNQGNAFTLTDRHGNVVREADNCYYTLSAGPYGNYRISAPLLYKDFFVGPDIIRGGVEVEPGYWLTKDGVYNYRLHRFMTVENGMVTLFSGKKSLKQLQKQFKLPKTPPKAETPVEEPKDTRKLPPEKIKWRRGVQKRDQKLVYIKNVDDYVLVVRPRKYPDDPTKIRCFLPMTGEEILKYTPSPRKNIREKSPSVRFCRYFSTGMMRISIHTLWRLAFLEDTIDNVPLDERFDLEKFGFSGYTLTRSGRVWSKKSHCWMTSCINGQIRMNDTNVLLGRLVALAFIPNPQGYAYVLHKNDPNDHSADNLMWAQRCVENNEPAMIRQSSDIPEIDRILQDTCGLDSKGKLSLDQIRDICTLIRQGLTDQLIALHTGQLVYQVQAFRRLYKAMCDA